MGVLILMNISDRTTGRTYRTCWLKSDNRGKIETKKDAMSGDWRCGIGNQNY